MTKHTPGPWIADIDAHYADGLPLTILSATSGDGIAGVAGHAAPDGDDGGATDKTYANARLIAAAPELLDALALALPYVEMAEHDAAYSPGTVARMVKTIRAAIAKAEGAL